MFAANEEQGRRYYAGGPFFSDGPNQIIPPSRRIPMTRTRFVLTALLLAIGATSTAPSSVHAQQKKSRDLITREEIDASAQKDQDIYEVIRGLRPHFLAPARGIRTLGNSSTRMSLYVDGARESDFNALKNIMAVSVEEVRYLDPTQSEAEYGSVANGGAVVLKRIKDGGDVRPPAIKPPQH
jgi:hypothetical protein